MNHWPKARFRPLEDARALAALRVVVAVLILISPELHQAEALAAFPETRFVPEGAGLFAALPLTPAVVHWLRLIALSSGALAVLGYYSRTALAVLTLSALPLYALSQLRGTVLHDMHLFWFSSLLAFSPCADVWSLDGWGKPPTRHPLEYAVPAMLCRGCLGIVYFFPGLHKLLESGWAWGSAPHVIAQLHAKWFQWAELPLWRIDREPWLCSLAGHGVLLFELSFGVLAAWRKTRLLAAALGLAFHWSTQAFLYIPFVSLWACYVVLVPWDALGRAHALPAARTPRPRVLPVLAFGSVLLAVAIVQGVRGQTQAWPIACYPTFAAITPRTLPDLLITVTTADGAHERFTGREHQARSQAEWGRVFRISGAYGDPPNDAALREHALEAARRTGRRLTPGSMVRVYRAVYSTAPEQWQAEPESAVLLSSFGIEA